MAKPVTEEEKVPTDVKTQTWGAKFVSPMVEEMEEVVKKHGYLSISEFIREACRDKLFYLKSKDSRLILDHLVKTNRLDPMDLRDAIHEALEPVR